MTQPLGRMELFARLGRITVVESMVDRAFEYMADHEWRDTIADNPHGSTWHTSMHVSSFPGDDARACPRQLAYGLMGFAKTESMPQKAIAAGQVGAAIEDWVVRMLGYEGRLLSAAHDAKHQIGLEDADHWLTGSPDLIVLPPFWNRPLVIEKKSAYAEQVDEMRALKRSYFPAHARQCRGYIGLGHHISKDLWPSAVVCRYTWRIAIQQPAVGGPYPGERPTLICRDHGAGSECLKEIELEPIQDGVILYSSRDHPETRASWYFTHDEQWFQKGLATLRRAQEHFAVGTIPPQPFGGKQWSAKPCQWCSLKKNVCKPDHQAKITQLTESHGVAWSREVFGGYDPQRIRTAVLERWRNRSGFNYHLPPGYELGEHGVQRSVAA